MTTLENRDGEPIEESIRAYVREESDRMVFEEWVSEDVSIQLMWHADELQVVVEVGRNYDHTETLAEGDDITDAPDDVAETGARFRAMLKDELGMGIELTAQYVSRDNETPRGTVYEEYVDRE